MVKSGLQKSSDSGSDKPSIVCCGVVITVKSLQIVEALVAAIVVTLAATSVAAVVGGIVLMVARGKFV